MHAFVFHQGPSGPSGPPGARGDTGPSVSSFTSITVLTCVCSFLFQFIAHVQYLPLFLSQGLTGFPGAAGRVGPPGPAVSV